MRVFLIVALSASVLFGQVLYEEHFTGGVMALDWHPWFTDAGGLGDSMQVISDPTTPEGDGWAGKISNEYMTVAGLTYAGTPDLTDYSIDAYIYTTVTAGSGGPYNGLAIRMDSTTRYYYRLVSDFDDDARIRLGVVAGGGYPVYLRDWTSGEIPGGVPTTSSWHKLKLMTIADSIWCFYDDVMLPDCPIVCDSVAQGYFGVYVFNMMAVDSTKCDGIIVRAEQTGLSEYETDKIERFTVYPNPFIGKTDIRYQITDASKAELKIYDATGRLIRQLDHTTIGLSDYIVWDGRDDRGNLLAPGVYFITANNQMVKVIKLQ